MQTIGAFELDVYAASVLAGRMRVEERVAMQALEEAAAELDVRLADLAALVVAASLMPPDWASRRGARGEATVGQPREDPPANPGEEDPNEPPPDNPSGMKPWTRRARPPTGVALKSGAPEKQFVGTP